MASKAPAKTANVLAKHMCEMEGFRKGMMLLKEARPMVEQEMYASGVHSLYSALPKFGTLIALLTSMMSTQLLIALLLVMMLNEGQQRDNSPPPTTRKGGQQRAPQPLLMTTPVMLVLMWNK
ncbi:hypothetical protein MHU86_19134 [Fragilaria crotonensis]|nr:hypothetical protein MHU86_19134 [Fragilaria crotonensis]